MHKQREQASSSAPDGAEEEECKKSAEPVAEWFQGVIQADFPDQMDVLRWLITDTSYTMVYILHDKDTFTVDEIAARASKQGLVGYFVRENGDGSKSEYRVGDVKPAHYHFVLHARRRIRASTLCKRFCNQVFFEKTSDRFESFRYLTHETFASRDKTRYNRDAVQGGAGGLQMYSDILSAEMDGISTVERIAALVSSCAVPDDDKCRMAAKRKAIAALIAANDQEALKSIMGHSFFYKEFI